MDCSPPGSSVNGIFQARILEWVAIFFSRGIFLTQRSNPGLPHCRRILYHLSYQGIHCTTREIPIHSFSAQSLQEKCFKKGVHLEVFSVEIVGKGNMEWGRQKWKLVASWAQFRVSSKEQAIKKTPGKWKVFLFFVFVFPSS